MKYNIAFKFLAVLLCAACLLGAVGSAAGILVLTEGELYDKTVPQVREEVIRSRAEALARDTAMYYCSQTLGGCPEELLDDYIADNGGYVYGWYNFGFQREHFGYALKDAEGNVLTSGGTLTGESGGEMLTFPISGKYLYLVSASPKNAPAGSLPTTSSADAENPYDAIPPEGATVGGVQFLDGDGNVLYYLFSNTGLGTAFHVQDGTVVYRSYYTEDWAQTGMVCGAVLQDVNGNVIYERHDPAGVGELELDDAGALVFFGTPVEQAETGEPIEESRPEEIQTESTTVQTEIPDETVAEQPQDGEDAQLSEPEQADTPEDVQPLSEEPQEEPAEQPQEEPIEELQEEPIEEPREEPAEEPDGENVPAEQAEDEEPAEPIPETTEAPTEPPATEPEPTQAPTIPETEPPETEPVLIDGKPLSQYQVSRYSYYDSESGEEMLAKCVYLTMPELTVEVYTEKGALEEDCLYDVLEIVRQFRNDLFLILGVSLLLFAMLAVYLCCAAGRKPKCDEIRAGGLNRLPLDLYLGVAVLGGCALAALGTQGAYYLLKQSLQTGCATAIAAAYAVCLLVVGFGFALAAQVKTPGSYWITNSICGRCIHLAIRCAVWLEKFLSLKGFPSLGRGCKKVWLWLTLAAAWLWQMVRRFGGWLKDLVHRFLRMLPVMWQWLLTGCAMVFLLFLSIATGSKFLLGVCMVVFPLIILYGAHCFGVLLKSTERMSKGDLDTQVDDKHMVGAFKDFAEDLNGLAGVAVVAAQKQLKSERMKTELITNVSHDIKTPLTSIINYVDLLQKPHTDEEQEQYLEVLARQSLRLKKLIDDLMEMSKASTGNMTVEVTKLDAVESVNQALGEFADKLDKAQIIPVFRHTEESVAMMADGRLVWRVLSNLLSNAVKYAMPGTRLYIDLMEMEGKVVISLKNISRDELNIEADELMERFVRGDDSRNTEGSGLGLNIAKSLMELQKGQLQLLVDGDLFKVTLIFPAG